jgi:hypothetical protein
MKKYNFVQAASFSVVAGVAFWSLVAWWLL